jgi:phenylalanyl-tRNA synthetase beta chain
MFGSPNLVELIKNVLVVEIIAIQKHPNADRLNIVTVSLGYTPEKTDINGLFLENGIYLKNVVTGATNIKVGDLVPFLYSGNVIPGIYVFENRKVLLQPKNLRGIVSDSMILSEFELGIGKDNTGIYVLPENAKKFVGSSILKFFNHQ